MSTLAVSSRNPGFPSIKQVFRTLGVVILAFILIANLAKTIKIEQAEQGFQVGFSTKAFGFVAICDNYSDKSGFVVKFTLTWGGLQSSKDTYYKPQEKPPRPPTCSNETENFLSLLTALIRQAVRELNIPTALGELVESLILESVKTVLKIMFPFP